MNFEKTDISKEELNLLETEEIIRPVLLIDETTPPADVKAICKRFSLSKVLGFDTETRPVFQKDQPQNPVSLLQLATEREVALFRLNQLRESPSMKYIGKVLSHRKITKVGVGIVDDAKELWKDYELFTSNLLDLRQLAKTAGLEVLSLSKMYALLYGKRLSKGQRVSNWELTTLSEAQIKYAALDAIAGLRIYDGLQEYQKRGMVVRDFRKKPLIKKRKEK